MCIILCITDYAPPKYLYLQSAKPAAAHFCLICYVILVILQVAAKLVKVADTNYKH